MAGGETRVLLGQPLTVTGALLGTPAYMAPEQYRGEPLDPRTDQLSFCVALYQALYRAHPFISAAAPPQVLAQTVAAAQVLPAPKGSRVPSWLREVVLRGLRADRDQRFPSMPALLKALESDPAIRRRRWAQGALFASVVLGLGALVIQQRVRQATVCQGSALQLAGVWDEQLELAM